MPLARRESWKATMLEKATIPCGQGVWGTLETPRRDAEQAAERTGAAEYTGVGPNREVLLGDTYLQTVHMQTGDEGRARMSSPRERAVGLALWSPDTSESVRARPKIPEENLDRCIGEGEGGYKEGWSGP